MRMRCKYVRIQHASARDVADRWRRQYQHDDGKWSSGLYGKGEAIYEALIAEGDCITIDKAAEIIGNKSWSFITCDSCNEYVRAAIEIGEDEAKGYCFICIKEAAEIIKQRETA